MCQHTVRKCVLKARLWTGGCCVAKSTQTLAAHFCCACFGNKVYFFTSQSPHLTLRGHVLRMNNVSKTKTRIVPADSVTPRNSSCARVARRREHERLWQHVLLAVSTASIMRSERIGATQATALEIVHEARFCKKALDLCTAIHTWRMVKTSQSGQLSSARHAGYLLNLRTFVPLCTAVGGRQRRLNASSEEYETTPTRRAQSPALHQRHTRSSVVRSLPSAHHEPTQTKTGLPIRNNDQFKQHWTVLIRTTVGDAVSAARV